MSLKPVSNFAIPEETARVARAVFPKGHLYLAVRDHFGPLFADETFAALFPTRGRPAESPARLALVTILQFAEGLSDRAAIDAVRSRIDWKYVLQPRERFERDPHQILMFQTDVGQITENGLEG